MGKFVNWIKKKLGISHSGGSSGAPDYGVSSPERSKIEEAIDLIVMENILDCKFLYKLQPDLIYWQSVFKALAFAESNFKLNCRYVEPPSLGKDAVTGMQNTSEGLLQLSYQDSRYYACEFDWNTDRKKTAFDLSKSIFDIQKNIKCGMMIMNKLVGKKETYIFDSGNYWAVLKPSNKRHKIFLNAFKKYQDNEFENALQAYQEGV